ncbi:MAG: hypothetical protein ACFFEF_07900 [Candidatus Thorarchaeota archaeon]
MLSRTEIRCLGLVSVLVCTLLIGPAHSGHDNAICIPCTAQPLLSSTYWNSRFNVTYTSYENATASPLRNDTSAVGNEFVINTAVHDILGVPELDVTFITTRLECVPEEIIFEQTKPGSSSTFAVPWRSHNITGNLFLDVITANATEYRMGFFNLMFNNSFAPIITSIQTNPNYYPLDAGTNLNITWTVFDLNIGDSHESEIYYSADEGYTFQLLARNISDDYYGWEAYFETWVYTFMVRVYDTKGLMNQRIHYGGGHHTIPPAPEPRITLSNPPDVEMMFGSTGNEIRWTPSSPYDGQYTIKVNGIQITNGVWYSDDGPIIYSVDGFLPGDYEVILNIMYTSVYNSTDTVRVVVHWGTTGMVVLGYAIGISFGFGVVSILYIHRKRRRRRSPQPSMSNY